MRILRKTALLLMLAVAWVCTFPVTADAYEYFDITEYIVNLHVNENNTIDVTETITADFFEPRHGIYRDIRYRGTFEREVDGEWLSTPYRARVYNIAVEGRTFEKSTQGVFKRIKIGDADRYVDGSQIYKITYTIDFGDDGIDRFDDLYFNLIGNSWDTTIEDVSMRIDMPKAFEASNVSFFRGYSWESNADGIIATVEGSTIIAETTEPLMPYQGVTIRLLLPEGYYVNERMPFNWAPLILSLSVLLTAAAWLLWLRFGKDAPLFPTVEFYPPNDLPPAEVGYIVDGIVETRDIISMLLYWADKGYIQLKEQSKREFLIIKNSELPASSQHYEKILFSGLFACGKTLSLGSMMDMFKLVIGGKADTVHEMLDKYKEEQETAAEAVELVSTKDLKDRFYTTIQTVQTSIQEKYKRKDETRLFTKSSILIKVLVGLVAGLPMALGIIGALASTSLGLEGGLGLGITLSACAEALLLGLSFTVMKRQSQSKAGSRVKITILIFFLSVIGIGSILSCGLIGNQWGLGLVSTASTLIIGWFFVFMDKRTKQSNGLLEKIIGLKQFIESAEKERLETLVDENPQYFYRVLAYAYVLGVTDVWAKRFEHIDMRPPSWYVSRTPMSTFTAATFTSSLSHSMRTVQASASPPSSSSSSGSSGGFSGGGGGGGGGGSW